MTEIEEKKHKNKIKDKEDAKKRRKEETFRQKKVSPVTIMSIIDYSLKV
jgi:hypothetical protein